MSDERALLLTDLVDSTKLTESLGDSAGAVLWAAHDRAARERLGAWRGREIDKSDGFLLLFECAADALGYALDYHRAVAAIDSRLRARAGLHIGAVSLRANDAADIARGAKPFEVEGVAKSVAARVMALAAGGQTLLTAAARAALGDSEVTTRVEPVGYWQLKGIVEPVALYAAAADGDDAALATPADGDKGWRVVLTAGRWRPVRETPHNLPPALSSFVGREVERADVLAKLGSKRLVTILGTGGLGKTRLAIEVANAALHDFPDGVGWVELAPLTDGVLVTQAVASAFGVTESASTSAVDAIAERLDDRRALLVLDNCEHVDDACARLADTLLRRLSKLAVLTTSREPLHVAGETVHALSGLALPGDSADMATLARSESVRLFVERATAAQPAFALDASNAAAVASICRRLDGIALAIELAAARVSTMPVASIAARLDDHFRILDRGPLTAPARQRTLRGLIDWSHDLLDERERVLFARLAVFAGGWTLEAAEAVGAGDPLDAADVLNVLAALVDKSLVVHDCVRNRYRMLETVAHYARDRLAERGEDAALRRRLRDWCLDLLATERPHVHGADQAARLARVAAEHDNVRGALTSAFASGDGESALRLAVESHGFLSMRGFVREARQALAAALELAPASANPDLRARALRGAGILAHRQADYAAARDFHERCLEIRRQQSHRAEEASSLESLGLIAIEIGDAAKGLPLQEQALELRRAEGEPQPIAQSLNNLGTNLYYHGQPERGMAMLEESLAIKRRIGDRRGVAMTLDNLGDFAAMREDEAEARRLYEESLAVRRELGDALGIQRCVVSLADLAVRRGDLVDARVLYAEGVGIARDNGDRVALLHACESLADLAEAEGAAARAAMLRGHADRLRAETGYALLASTAAQRERALASTRAAIGDDAAFQRAVAAGAAMSTDEAIALVFARMVSP
jgi:predicted ATPase/class 3 adenylate cyclase